MKRPPNPLPLDRDTVLTAFGEDDTRALKVVDISKALDLAAEDRAALRLLVRALVQEGDSIARPGRRFSLATSGTLVEGRVQRTSKTYGWLLPDDESLHDAFIPPKQMAGLFDGDRVLCRITSRPKGPAADVVKVLARGRTTLMGTLRRSRIACWLEPAPSVYDRDIVIPPGPEGGADGVDDGTVVEVGLVGFGSAVTSAVARVLRVIGKEGELAIEIERLILDAGITRPFSPEAEAQAASVGDQPRESDKEGRLDLRETPLVTIDGITAKDFDDAVFAAPDAKGWEVTVAIADVAHYVPEGSPLDIDARARSTSMYYPGKCIPMLPEALSNGLCSLNPDVDRLCMVLQMRVAKTGAVSKVRLSNGVMRSHARLTYEQVQAFYDGDNSIVPKPVHDNVRTLRDASRALRAARRGRGSLDFDFKEPSISLTDEGLPTAIGFVSRAESNRVIEDLMIAANEAVAGRFEEVGRPCLFRVHEPPDPEKLERFWNLAKRIGVDVGTASAGPPSPQKIADSLASIQDSLLKPALEFLLLRAMMQARYSVDNAGHFGLGSDAYLHFTSPIRRYPDLVVHRQVKALIKKPKARSHGDDEELASSLEDIADHCSAQERRAMGAERNIDALYAAWFMRDKVGEEHTGIVSGCAEFGAFVRLDAHHVEGLVHVSEISREPVSYDEMLLRLRVRSGFSLGVGDKVRVQVKAADIPRRQITLALLEVTAQQGRDVELTPPRHDEGGDEAPGRHGRGSKSAAAAQRAIRSGGGGRGDGGRGAAGRGAKGRDDRGAQKGRGNKGGGKKAGAKKPDDNKPGGRKPKGAKGPPKGRKPRR